MMVRLRRTVRFAVNAPEFRAGPGGANGYGGKPPMRGLGRQFEIDVACEGEPDPATGYLVNIKTIDEAVRRAVVPAIERACDDRPGEDPVRLIGEFGLPLAEALAPVDLRALRWKLTPTYSVEQIMANETGATPRVLLRQRFDFAAAHRLHVPTLSDEENRRVFGKCNNPSGHGHNYQVEPCVAITPGGGFGVEQLEAVVDEVLIEPFDHTHLNEDTTDFSADGGVNPTVENIAKVFYERLAPAVSGASDGAELVSLTVWETDRTCCTYPA